jgi:hypothetical protein
MAIMALLWSFQCVIIRSYGDLIGDCLRSDSASTAFFALPQRFHGGGLNYEYCNQGIYIS